MRVYVICQSLKERIGKTLVIYEVLKTSLFLLLLPWELIASVLPNFLGVQIWYEGYVEIIPNICSSLSFDTGGVITS